MIEPGQTFFHNGSRQNEKQQPFKTGWACCGETLKPYVVKCPSCRTRRRRVNPGE